MRNPPDFHGGNAVADVDERRLYNGAVEEVCERLQHAAGDDVRRQLQLAWQLAYSRPATEAEIDETITFLNEQVAYLKEHPITPPAKKEGEPDPPPPPTPQFEALANLCHVLLSSNEFLYVE